MIDKEPSVSGSAQFLTFCTKKCECLCTEDREFGCENIWTTSPTLSQVRRMVNEKTCILFEQVLLKTVMGSMHLTEHMLMLLRC